jgi:hypothetical protein
MRWPGSLCPATLRWLGVVSPVAHKMLGERSRSIRFCRQVDPAIQAWFVNFLLLPAGIEEKPGIDCVVSVAPLGCVSILHHRLHSVALIRP